MRIAFVILALAFTSAIATIATAVTTTSPAGAVTSEVQDFVGRINQLRTSRGLNSLAIDANLAQLAQDHTQQMAATLSMVHTADLRAGVTTPYIKLGENVGYGSSTDLLWNAFLASPSHLENLLDPAFTHVGVGVVTDRGVQWTTHRFLQAGQLPPRTYATPPPPPITYAPPPSVVSTLPRLPPTPPATIPTTTIPKPTVPPTTQPAPPTTELPPTTATLSTTTTTASSTTSMVPDTDPVPRAGVALSASPLAAADSDRSALDAFAFAMLLLGALIAFVGVPGLWIVRRRR